MIIFSMVFILTFLANDILEEKGTISLIPVGKVISYPLFRLEVWLVKREYK